MTQASTLPNLSSIGDRTHPASPKTAGRHRGRWAIAVVLLVGVGLVSTAVAVTHKSTHALAAEAPNIPRVDGKRIVFSDNYAKRIQLESVEVGNNPMVPAFSVIGTVTFDPTHVARVGARLRGLVRDVYRFEGDKVKAGESLASIDSPELGEAQASVSMLGSENYAAQLHRTRERALAERQLTTPRVVEEASAAAERSEALLAAAQHRVSALAGRKSASGKRGLGVHTFTSPLSGTIIERHVARGQLVEANHVAFLVADLDHVWVELSVFERVLPSIKVGDLVELQADGASEDSATDVVKGEVAQVGAVLNAESRGATVRVHVDNRARKFRPGQSVNAVIRATAATVDNVTTVPASAIAYVDGDPSVFVADTPTSVVVTAVELGETNGPLVHVKSGVQAGQRVIVRGTTELRNELFR